MKAVKLFDHSLFLTASQSFSHFDAYGYHFSRIKLSNGFPSFIALSASSSASSSFSASDSEAGFSDQSFVSESKKKRRKIAGIDQDELLEPQLLADSDSCFCEFEGVKVHYKFFDPNSVANSSFQTQTPSLPILPHRSTNIHLPIILLHGFGASVFSWSRALKPLAKVTGSKVLAFDRPAFGLTSRVFHFGRSSRVSDDTKPLNPYSMAYSVLATLYFIGFLGAEKAVLVGHSAGSFVAVNTYFQAPERVAALVLIAPAILAPLITHKGPSENELGRDEQTKDDISSSNNLRNLLLHLSKTMSKFVEVTLQAILRMMKTMVDVLKNFYRKILSALLRSDLLLMLVRVIIDRFGVAAVRSAWYDSTKVNEHVVDGYIKPLRIKDWDKALVEYTAAMLTNADPPLSKRLHEISCPVLIITGDSDRIVPSWNAERLSRAIPGSCLEIIKQCGHLPHEEKVEEFVLVVQTFLLRVLGDTDEQRLVTVI